MARRLADDLDGKEGTAVVLLGAAHDLAPHVRRELPGWRLVRVTTAQVARLERAYR